MSKPKDWGIVKFLTKKVPGLAGKVAEVAGNVILGNETTDAIKDVITGSTELSEADKELALAKLDADLERERLAIQDRDSARTMQNTALDQKDLFSKRFVYYFAAGTTFLSFLSIILLYFVEIPEANKSTIYMALGAIIGTGLTGIFQFFFGSSSGSKEKDSIIGQFSKMGN